MQPRFDPVYPSGLLGDKHCVVPGQLAHGPPSRHSYEESSHKREPNSNYISPPTSFRGTDNGNMYM